MILATGWIKFWEAVLVLGFGSFALLVLIVIPLGARDILRLFKKLDSNSVQPKEPQD